MKITILPEQEKYISSQHRIQQALLDTDVIAFDIFQNELLIGFVLLKKFDEKAYFLWNFAIDYRYQNKKYGLQSLQELIIYLQENYDMELMTTTYTYGNNHAKHLYEKIGFAESSVIHDESCHEINMIYSCDK